jgi:hypothetical protein
MKSGKMAWLTAPTSLTQPLAPTPPAGFQAKELLRGQDPQPPDKKKFLDALNLTTKAGVGWRRDKRS